MPTTLPHCVASRLDALPAGLRDHVERVRDIGRRLAQRHGVDDELVDLGIAAHDLARHLGGAELVRRAEALNIAPNAVERRLPVLLHGHVAAAELERDGLTDDRVLESVRWHTTGHRGMGDVAKVVLLADKLDPQKARRYPYLPEIEKLARDSLDAALLRFLELSTADHLGHGRLIHPESIELRNELLLAASGHTGTLQASSRG